ncbi:MAG: lamin tail domain-containing protein [Planctomycetes bacterium]|nr:lamin tail domain-containing protein [Planctomycetota bacterium]
MFLAPPRLVAAAAALLATSSLPALAQVVLNEVHYDAPGSDEGFVFVEVYGPLNADISGWRIQGVEGSGASAGTNNAESFVFPPGTVIGSNGRNFVVVADGVNTSTTLTNVPFADFIVADMDLENGPDGVQLLNAQSQLVDAVAHGAVTVAIGEGSPVRNVFAPLSLQRCGAGRDSGDNQIDFTPALPTPGTDPVSCAGIEWVNLGFGNNPRILNGDRVGLDFWFSNGAGRPYIVLMAFTDPALVPPPPPLPVYDLLTAFSLEASNLPPFIAWSGVLGPRGELEGVCRFDLGVPPNFPLTTTIPSPMPMYVGAVALDGNGVLFGTNYVTLTIRP